MVIHEDYESRIGSGIIERDRNSRYCRMEDRFKGWGGFEGEEVRRFGKKKSLG